MARFNDTTPTPEDLEQLAELEKFTRRHRKKVVAWWTLGKVLNFAWIGFTLYEGWQLTDLLPMGWYWCLVALIWGWAFGTGLFELRAVYYAVIQWLARQIVEKENR